MESYNFNFYSTKVNLILFKQVKNSKKIKQDLINAASMKQDDLEEKSRLDWCFIDASMITSRQHLFTAIFQALVSQSHDQLKTKTIHSEILWTLSPGTNITEAIKKFGLGAETSDVLLVKILGEKETTSCQEMEKAAKLLIDGTINELNKLGERSIVNWKEIRRMYKLNDDPIIKQVELQKKKVQDDDLDGQLYKIIDQLVSAAVALKSVAS